MDDVDRIVADVDRKNGIYRGAQVLAGHFGLRDWYDMASDRGELRRKVRDKSYDPNEPTVEDCMAAFEEALKAYEDAVRARLAEVRS